MSYCQFVLSAPPESLHHHYHDEQYGFPIHDDDELFGRLILEINQAGLNWGLMLQKQENFRKAFANFQVEKVAAFDKQDIERLLQDKGIIRNRLKIRAVIHNARAIKAIQAENGSWLNWLKKHQNLSEKECLKVFKKHFKFVGGEIVKEFMMSASFWPGAHDESCPTYQKTIDAGAFWK
ncbi:MAG: DNA-3-methyladenine glycosylase I [Cyclobacteriaceae bacterium]|nr:DNA-3-methyladenine glycosylase I [Cyclobacteriaceae bacterium]MCH8514777.1 DNA-3-methyladenine glycosylase I [Cyclobacteriaceae bacterium]